MKTKVLEVLNSVLPKETYIKVEEREMFYKTPYLKIAFAVSDHDINNVKGQKPQLVSLCLDLVTLKLEPRSFGGNGGRVIYRNPNMNDPKECYLTMKGVKIPFRKPQNNEKAVLRALEKFANNYIKTLKDNRLELRYQDIVNYSEILK